jgi:hypothetical protein
VLPIPASLVQDATHLPTAEEVRPWFDAVCALWDDRARYERIAARAKRLAEERYSERVSRQKHVDYFTSLKPHPQPIADAQVT